MSAPVALAAVTAPLVFAEAAPATWHIAQVRARSEYGVGKRLRELGFAVFWPHRHVQRRHARRVREGMEPLIPGYLFFALRRGQGLMAVNDCWGVIEVLYGATSGERAAPYVLDPRVLGALRRDTDADGCMGRLALGRAVPRDRLAVGTVVRIVEGVFAGYAGAVAGDDGRLVEVEVTVFRRVVPVRLDPAALEPVAG